MLLYASYLKSNFNVTAIAVSGQNEREKKIMQGHDVDQFFRPVGCEKCELTGYKGRTGIYEMITIDDKLRTMIHERKSEDQMLKYLRPFTKSLLNNGLEKVALGITSLDEVIRVTRIQ